MMLMKHSRRATGMPKRGLIPAEEISANMKQANHSNHDH